MSLVLEIEFLTGVYRAAHSPASNTPDWPPQPDRVFSGLVAAWVARGEQSVERLALEWLEAQSTAASWQRWDAVWALCDGALVSASVPVIHAGDHTARTAPAVFVPPNDQRSSTKADTYLKVMPEIRSRKARQPRRFPVARLDDPVMAMIWSDDPDPKTLAALDALARDVGYIGHSASLVRCRFLSCSSPAPAHRAVPVRRQVYRGRLQELRRAYRANPARPVILPGATVLPEPAAAPALRKADWLVLEAIEGAPPAWPRPGAPPWTRWRVPEALRSRLLTHVAIDFGCEVAGPVMLGAGRFTGLGLCRRLGGGPLSP